MLRVAAGAGRRSYRAGAGAAVAPPRAPSSAFSSGLGEETGRKEEKLERIADELLALNKLERYDYAILFALKMGVNRWGRGVQMPTPGGAGSEKGPAPSVAAEKTSFDVKLEKFEAAAKIKVIKEVRGFTDLGLKEAKELVEKAPVVVKKQVTKEEAEKIAAKLKEIGATVVLE